VPPGPRRDGDGRLGARSTVLGLGLMVATVAVVYLKVWPVPWIDHVTVGMTGHTSAKYRMIGAYLILLAVVGVPLFVLDVGVRAVVGAIRRRR
jgi:hypothetical protein